MINKKMNKSLFIKAGVIVLSIILIAGVFGCNNLGKKQGGDVDDEGKLIETRTEDEMQERVRGTITFTVNNESGTETEAMAPKAVVNAFMSKYQNAKVVYEEANRTTYATRISAGDIGDVFWCDADDTNNYQRNHDALMPLDSYLKPLNINMGDIYTGALDAGRIQGRLYMVPRKIGEQILIYNDSMLTEAGIDFDNSYAYSWEAFKEVCKQLTIIEDGKVMRSGAAFKIWWSPIWQMFFRGFGGDWIDSINHEVHIVDSNEVMMGVNELVAGVQEGWLYPEDMTGNINSIKYDIPDGDSNISKVCFKTFGAMTWLTRLGNAYDNLKIDWDFCPFPAFPTHNISTGATGYVVYNRTKNPDTAAAFALFFLTPEGQTAYHSQTGGNVPLLKSLADEDFWKGVGTPWEDKNYAAFVSYPDQTAPSNIVTQAPTEIAEIFSNNNMINTFAQIFNGKADAQTAFNQMQTKANEKWKTIMSD
jgi:multiple sugar transport system substrate-binding protein